MSAPSKPRTYQPPKPRVRETPTLMEVQIEYGETPVMPYDEHFLKRGGQQARAIATVEKIRDIGEALLADPKLGLNWMTTAHVAAAAGISIGTFYRYFEDIIALLDYIWPERATVFARIKGSS